jgi:hypothetical protein
VAFLVVFYLMLVLQKEPHLPSTDLDFNKLTIVAHGGDGTTSSNKKGVRLETQDFAWLIFNIELKNESNFVSVDYSLSPPGNSVLGVLVDEKPLTYIQNATDDPPTTLEVFPLKNKLSPGKHSLCISFESLDKKPIGVSLNNIQFVDGQTPPEFWLQVFVSRFFGWFK